MKVSSVNIPQADRLTNVIQLIQAVGMGGHTDEELIRGIPSLNTTRQGRYYRLAAQIMGFINNHQNHAKLTPAGQQLLKNPTLTNPLFIAAVLSIDVIQQLLPLLEVNPAGVTRKDIELHIGKSSAPVGPSVIPRRTSTIIAWLRELQVIEERGHSFFLNKAFTTFMPVLEVPDIEQPLFPVTADLREYQVVERRSQEAKEAIMYYKDAAKLERSNHVHQQLVNLVAERITAAGGVAKSNALIDLATAVDDDFIFEMKSINDSNTKSQIRKGLSQLYEYRYLQNKASAKLVLVMEKALPKKEAWMVEYLESDRNIHVIWDGDGNLYGSSVSQHALKFLNLR
jgi:chorismate mutase